MKCPNLLCKQELLIKEGGYPMGAFISPHELGDGSLCRVSWMPAKRI